MGIRQRLQRVWVWARGAGGRAEQDLDQLFEVSLELLCMIGLDGFLKRVNPAWERALGYSREELLAEPLLHFVHPADGERTALIIQQVGAGSATVSFENRVRAKDGSYRWLQWASAAVPGRPMLFASARDVTDRVTTQEILSRAQAELQNSVREQSAALRVSTQALAKSEGEIVSLSQELEARIRELTASNREMEAFTYSVSHDLRAPLRHIDGFSKILMDEHGEGLPEQVQTLLGRIRAASQRMGRMVDELLELSRTGRREPEKRLAGLRPLVDEAIEDLAADAAGREVEWRVGDLPFVDCDPALTRQVFANLLSNALKFTRPRRRAVIEVGQTSSNGTPVLFVRDNGVGFSMKYVDKLFGVFQRLHRREDFEGTGVGLATVQRIIQKHGGRIWAEAVLDEGATFYFTLGPGTEDGSSAGNDIRMKEAQNAAK